MFKPPDSHRRCLHLEDDGLEAVRVALAEKLRRHYRQSEGFIAETAEEMVDQAFVEGAEALERGEEIRSPVGWLITTAERRAIDRIRREGREVYGEGAQNLIAHAEDPAPSTEALAIQGIEAAELHEAVAELGDEHRRALALYYWEGLSTRAAATAMGLSTMTFCRRRDSAISLLRERFGVGAGEAVDEHLCIETGFAAWVGLMVGGANGSLANRIAGATGSTPHSVAWLVGRIRDLAAKALGSGGGEGITGATSGSMAKTLGLCATTVAAALCGAGAAGIGPGADLIAGTPSHVPTTRPETRPSKPRAETSTAALPQTPKQTSRIYPKHGSGARGRPASRDRGRHRPRAKRTARSESSEFGLEPPPEYHPVQPESTPVEPESTPVEPTTNGNSAPHVRNEEFGL